MTDYTKLVESLRCCASGTCDSERCDYMGMGTYGCMIGLAQDAAAAIEELKDKPWVESVQIDKLRQRIDELEETACHCNVKENAELIAKILDDDVDGKVFELPKRGEVVRCGECKHHELSGGSHMCRQLGMLSVDPDWFCADGEREVQE